MAPIEHKKPAAGGQSWRVLFDVEASDLGEAEVLWGDRVTQDTLRLDNIPLLAFGVSMGDVVRVCSKQSTLHFQEVVKRGGHSTYRVMMEAPDDRSTKERFRDVIVAGCGYEQLTARFAAIDVPPSVDIFRVYDLLERGLDAGAWTFEEGHCGHRTQ